MRRASLAILLLACGTPPEADAGLDAAASDASMRDAGTDAAVRDASPADAGRDAASDAASDAGGDASAPDAGVPIARVRGATWVRTVQGVVVLAGPHIAVAPDGTVVASLAYRDGVTFGEGEEGEVTLTGEFDPALAFFDASDGHLLAARQIASDQSTTARATFRPEGGLDVSAEGAIYVMGAWHGAATFHPGTAAARSWTTESHLAGDSLYQAVDPFVVRYDAEWAPSWVTRGRTPGPLTESWTNWGLGIAAVPGGGAFVVGRFESSGFVVGDGTSGATTLSGSEDAYFARFDDTGTPTWVALNTDLTFLDGVEVAADGSATMLAGIAGTGTLLADTAGALTLTADVPPPGAPERLTYALVRISAEGEVAWARRIVVERPSGTVIQLALRSDGSAVVSGRCRGVVELRDASDAVALTETCAEMQPFVASYGADGSVEWLTLLGPRIQLGSSLATDASGRAWLATVVGVDQASVPLDDGPALLPALPEASEGVFTLLHVVGADGAREDAQVIGQNLHVRQLAISDGAAVVTGLYYDGQPEVRVAEDGELVDLPPSDPSREARAFFIRYAP